jgi:hypothetical protein
MVTAAFYAVPGGTEWLCLLIGLALLVGFVLFILYVSKRAANPPPYVPRVCGQCQRGNLADARFCAYCGHELTPPTGGDRR